MKNKSFSSGRKLVKRIERDDSKPESLIQLLELKTKKPIILNPKFIRNKNKFDKSENKLALETLKLIEEANINFDKNINNYNHNKEKNELFSKRFKKFKSREIKNKEEKVKKYQFTFGNLIRAYEKKGRSFDSTFLYKGIYNKSGILLRKKKLIEDYFSDEVKKEGNKSKKIVKYKNFMNKLLTEAKKRLIIQFPPTQKMLEEEKQKKEENIKKEELEECLKKQKEIEKLISENNLLKKLIKENKENLIAKNFKTIIEKKNNEEDKKIFIYTNNDSELNSSYNEMDNNNIENKNKKKENNMENIDNDEYNNVSVKNKKIKEEKEKNNKKISHAKSSRNILKRSINEISNSTELKKEEKIKNVSSLPNIQIIKEKMKKTVSFNNSIINSSNTRTIESELFKTRLKDKINKNSKILPSFDKRKNKSKLNLRNSKKRYSLNNSGRTLMKSQYIKNNNSIINISSLENIYNNLKKQDINSKDNKINEILKEFYGNTINNFDYKKNGIRIFNFFYKIKERITENEKNDRIYSKYKELLPKKLRKKIILNKQFDEILKNRAFYFIDQTCYTINKLSQKSLIKKI